MESDIKNVYNIFMNLDIKPPIAILGYGVEGKAAFSFLQNKGIKNITVFDESMKEDMNRGGDIMFKNKLNNLSSFNTIIRSPGVYYKRLEIQKARDAGVNITSMTELTLEIASKRITAITGSNGKTTTTGLVEEILQRHYKGRLIIGGNDKFPVLKKALDNKDWPIVMEVSSFQFADLQISPHISAVLNITPNHLDWHENLDDYINAKENLIKHQTKNDWAVLNANNEGSAKMGENASSNIFWIGEKRGENWAMWQGDTLGVNGKAIINKNELKVKTHTDNIAFAAAIATIHGVEKTVITEAIKNFTGIAHRIEFVRKLNGINFYNDSSCTTPESAEVAIEQFEDGKLIIMLGGSTKHSNFAFLASKIKHHNVRVYLYGEEGVIIKKTIEEAKASDQIVAYNHNSDFEAVIKDVISHAKQGDNIVLSPACASFDMFKNSKNRGLKFKEIVNSL